MVDPDSDETMSQGEKHMSKYPVEDLRDNKAWNDVFIAYDEMFMQELEDLSDISCESSECQLVLEVGGREFNLDA